MISRAGFFVRTLLAPIAAALGWRGTTSSRAACRIDRFRMIVPGDPTRIVMNDLPTGVPLLFYVHYDGTVLEASISDEVGLLDPAIAFQAPGSAFVASLNGGDLVLEWEPTRMIFDRGADDRHWLYRVTMTPWKFAARTSGGSVLEFREPWGSYQDPPYLTDPFVLTAWIKLGDPGEYCVEETLIRLPWR